MTQPTTPTHPMPTEMPTDSTDPARPDQLAEPLAGPRAFRLRVPATSANLGPGYDSMGLALGLYDVIDVLARPRQDPQAARIEVSVDGEGAGRLPTDASHLVVVLIEEILASRGYRLPDLQVGAQNLIPHSRGLGSSAAAVASAVVTASQLLPEGLSADEQLQIGARIEGHPDNYVPALRGGVAVSWQTLDTGPEQSSPAHYATAALLPHRRLRLVLAVPEVEQSTEQARSVLPGQVSHQDAARNAARAALLVHALTTDPALLLEATEDCLHQPYRRTAYAPSMALVETLRAAGHPAVVSGAGPSVLVLTDGEQAAEAARAHVEEFSHRAGADTFDARILPLSATGATVEEYPR